MFVVLRSSCLRSSSTLIRYGVSSLTFKGPFSTHMGSDPNSSIPVGTLVNNQLFDKLVRKPYQKQQYNPKHISNIKFAEVIMKHGFLDSTLVICATLGACALCSQFGWMSSSLVHSFSDSHYFLNRLFPFLQSISSVPMKNTFELWTLLYSYFQLYYVAPHYGLQGCRRELNKLYAKYEKENEELLIEEKPGFIQSCSLEDGCSMRLYGDECQHGNNRKFTKQSTKDRFYDGYGGDCSFKAHNNK